VERINDNVLRMGTPIVNWYLVADDDGVTVVDAAFPAYGSQLGEGLRELGRSQRDVKAVVLTHAHADHVGFAEQLRRKLHIPVYVHRHDEELAGNLRPFGSTASSMAPYLRYRTCLRFLGEWIAKGGARPHPITEVTCFDDGDELPVPGRLRAIHTPGHTDGHAAFVTCDALITGDALCTLNPLTGERGPQVLPAAVSSSVDDALASLDKLVGTGASVVLPGHGDPQPEPSRAVDEAKRRGPT
jgi:glyoxylase-like metal-dependent hydrolase (beta-lactamase superfamily II)